MRIEVLAILAVGIVGCATSNHSTLIAQCGYETGQSAGLWRGSKAGEFSLVVRSGAGQDISSIDTTGAGGTLAIETNGGEAKMRAVGELFKYLVALGAGHHACPGVFPFAPA